jgi:Ca2+-binding RTX toxin-like protein
MDFDGSLETDGSFRIFAGAGDDSLSGAAGADLIAGGLGGDTLRGGGGNDVFRYDGAADSSPSATDLIEDFSTGDRIDLGRIDADAGLAGDQAFSFIGSAAFGNHAGELRYENVAGTTWLVQGDTDGDGSVDLELLLVAAGNPVAADFIL